MERLPGLALIALGAVASWVVASLTPSPIGAAIPAVVAGWLLGARGLHATVRVGVQDGTKLLLLGGVVLLGFTIDLSTLQSAGTTSLALALSTIVLGIGVAWGMARLLRIPSPLALIVGIGTAICGVAAMVAAKDAAKAKDEDLVTATVLITVLGSVGMVLLPLLSIHRGIDAVPAGQWMGASLHAVPQAIGAGFAAGGLAGADAAALVKMTRVALLPVAVVALGWLSGQRSRTVVPKEVLGFVGALVLGNIVAWPQGSIDMVGAVAGWLFVGGLVGMGLQTNIQGMREAGWRAWSVAGATFGAVLVASLAILHL